MGAFGRMKMSHMIADTTDELMNMADLIGVSRRWVQYSGTWREHFDVSMSARVKAIQAGAVEITMRELSMKTHAKREAKP
jgi:hypothetical protein